MGLHGEVVAIWAPCTQLPQQRELKADTAANANAWEIGFTHCPALARPAPRRRCWARLRRRWSGSGPWWRMQVWLCGCGVWVGEQKAGLTLSSSAC